jgi:hypothetical protein
MAKSTEAATPDKQKTKLDHFVEHYILSHANEKVAIVTMRERWAMKNRDMDMSHLFPIYTFEDVKITEEQKKAGILNYKVIQKHMSSEALFAIVKHDPTSILKDNAKGLKDIVKVGGYVQWIVNQYFKLIPDDFKGANDTRYLQIRDLIRVWFEDLYKIKEDLLKFYRFKGKLPEKKHDIFQVKDTEELYDLTKDFSLEKATTTKAELKQRILKENVKFHWEDDRWEIIQPLSGEASYELAGPPLTRWCTASSQHSNYHHSYANKGPLYIIRDKDNIIGKGKKGGGEPKPMYQFHFETSQFMDEDDRHFDIVPFLMKSGHEGLKEFFRPNFKNAFNNREFDVNDKTFQNYVSLYGANEDIQKLVLEFLKNKVQSSDEIIVMEDNKEYSGFIQMLKHDLFFSKLFEYARPTTRVFEITFKNYQGQGIEVPASLGKLVNVTNMVLSGFVKSIPKEIGLMKKLELCSFTYNPNLKGIPPELADLPNLQVCNVIQCSLSSKDMPKNLMQLEESGRALVVFG